MHNPSRALFIRPQPAILHSVNFCITFYYSEDESIKTFCRGLNPDQAKRIVVWLDYAEKHVSRKFQMAPPATTEQESWRNELRAMALYQSALRECILEPKIIVPGG